MQQIETEYKTNGGKFKKYKISDLFNISSPAKRFNANAVKFGGKYPYVVRTSKNNGIRDYITEDEKYLSPANTFSFGQDTATVFYQDKPYFTGDKIKVMKLKVGDLNKERACYLLSILRKAFSNFSWGQTSFNETILNDVEIIIPTKNNQIDFEYMEERIRVLEEERIRVLEAYLKITGLDKYILTKEEQDAYDTLHNGGGRFKLYAIGSLFNIHPTKAYRVTNHLLFQTRGKTPVVTNSSTNNGISGYINLSPTERGGIVTYSDTTTSDGIFFQPVDFIGYPHVQGVYPIKESEWNEKTLLFFVSTFRKSAGGRFDYANKFNRSIAKTMNISLPCTKNGKIDYEFMETYIKAIEKKVIQNVIRWKDKEIEKTKEVVNLK